MKFSALILAIASVALAVNIDLPPISPGEGGNTQRVNNRAVEQDDTPSIEE
ncbi:hypothetical protein OOU_Y34scaffold00726g28 [Pyricularia oryzae Y34]|uniref:Uncharacterized protein n=2 Tax=Pyricularia oryzae TaxID=318829 RepID=A0AA97NRS4_PYRO3|nr:hypothetical protein OOU_Y34scaffold00726g28 [Pyricularia oryzae Y34]